MEITEPIDPNDTVALEQIGVGDNFAGIEFIGTDGKGIVLTKILALKRVGC